MQSFLLWSRFGTFLCQFCVFDKEKIENFLLKKPNLDNYKTDAKLTTNESAKNWQQKFSKKCIPL